MPPQNPIIGIYTIDAEDFGQERTTAQTYIAASYVKNIQMSAAQVVPLYYHYSHQQLDTILPKLNGVFFTGGAMPISWDNQYTSNLDYIMKWANRENDAGRPFPLWGTCLGYEAIMYLHSGERDNMTVLTGVKDRLGLVDKVKVTDTTSSLIKALSADEIKDMTSGEGLFWFDHYWVITTETYRKYEGINKFWKLVTTSETKEGLEFISTLEARNYPYFLVQHHPEKNSFEWGIDARRDYNAIRVPQKWINTFMKVARLSPNRMDYEEFKATSIYNYDAFYKPGNYFTTVYLFDERNPKTYEEITQLQQ